MFLTNDERQGVLGVARSYGIDGIPTELVTDALHAICVGKADDAAYRVAEAAGVVFIGKFIWSKEATLDADRARAILRVGALPQHAAYEGPIPEDDAQAIKDAEELVSMAQEAWDQHIRGETIEAILNEANNASENGRTAKADEKAPEPAPEDSGNDHLAQTEPWEDYDSDRVGEIIEGINVFIQEGEDVDALLAHIWAYESKHKQRVRILNHLERISQDRKDEEPKDEEPEPQEEEPAEEEGGEEPPADPAPQEAGTEGSGGAEEGPSDGQEAPAPGREPEPDAESQSAGEADEEGAEDRRGEDGAKEAEEARPGDREDIEEHDLIADVQAQLKRELLHIPPPIEEAPPEMPFDLTTLSDTDLQRLYMQFAAYAYRANYLLLIQEASARRAKTHADELHRELLVASDKYDEQGKLKTMTILEAEVEQDSEVKKWRKIQHKHDEFALSYRGQRDSYNKFVEALSRLETMRDNEFDRSGGQRSRRGRS